MSSIFISVGQCGNQLANTLLDFLTQNKTTQTSYLFDHYDHKYHFINLDSEIKVINNLLTNHSSHLRQENVINTKCGRGSNWASGYTGLEKDKASQLINSSLESIRREMERCDFLLSFYMFHSLSGGTGGGCGSKLVELLRDEYGSKKYLFTQSVAPFSLGELPLQHYNNLLCMSHLNKYTDSICLHQNDDVLSQIERMANLDNRSIKNSLNPLTKKVNENITASVSINDMNRYIIKSFLSTIYPVDSVSLKTQSIGMEYLEMHRFLCSNPNLKIIEIYNLKNKTQQTERVVTNSAKWNPFLKSFLSLIPKYKQNLTDQFVSLNSLIIARGQDASSSVLWQDYDMIKKSLNPVDWNPFTVDFWSSKDLIETKNQKSSSNKESPASLTIVMNRNKCVDYLKEVINKASCKYNAKAYLHWYYKFNITNEDFGDAFENVQQMVDYYEMMTK